MKNADNNADDNTLRPVRRAGKLPTMRYTCWTCGATRALDDETIEGCCYDTLTEMSTAINRAVLRHLDKAMPVLMEQRNAMGDKIADRAIVSDDPRARKLAIEWRNFRRGRGA
jgi:hypothetical protein